jgi:hypothetical protein
MEVVLQVPEEFRDRMGRRRHEAGVAGTGTADPTLGPPDPVGLLVLAPEHDI